MSWLSYHLFYHGDRTRLLLELVRPLTTRLLDKQTIDRFFFVRYLLGGPHVRLRLRALPGQETEVDRELTAASQAFFASQPSKSSMPEHKIRRLNEGILASDPNEDDDSIYPDNTLQAFPFRTENSRYGGAALLNHSLDYFAGSSALSLEFLADYGEEPWPRRSPYVFRLLARLALVFSQNPGEFLEIISYPIVTWGDAMKAVIADGDRVYDKQRHVFHRLLRTEIDTLAEPLSIDDELSLGLAWEVRTAPNSVRRTILTSHLHMTANRLGLTNPEEAYLCRILWHASGDLFLRDPRLTDLLREQLATWTAVSPLFPLTDVVTTRLRKFVAARSPRKQHELAGF